MRGVIVTARGNTVDFVSRCLARTSVFSKIQLPALHTRHSFRIGRRTSISLVLARDKFPHEAANLNVNLRETGCLLAVRPLNFSMEKLKFQNSFRFKQQKQNVQRKRVRFFCL